jgi:hypothetical protein
MSAPLLDYLMILSLGILAGTGAGVIIGFIAGKQRRGWAFMQKKDKMINILLILTCSAIVVAALAWYVFRYSVK